jgi:hypothetical protein
MTNPFVHVELNPTDVAKAKEFYGSLFDWKLEDVPMGVMGTYTTIGVGGGRRDHEAPDAGPTVLLAVLRERGRCSCSDAQGETLGGDHYSRRYAGRGDGLADHLY